MRILLLFLSIVFGVSEINAQTKFVRVSFTNEDPSENMAVTWNSDSLNDPSEDCKPVTFIVLGDGRSDDSSGPTAKWDPILMQAADEKPAFILNTGDLVKDGGETDQWLNWLKMSDPALAFIPQMPVLGNHDDGSAQGDGANYNQIFNLPRNDVFNNEDFYFFTYGNIIVVGLSTQTFEDGNPPFKTQADWLDKVLTENPRMWKFVFFHHHNYTSYKNLFGLDLNHPPN